MSEINVTARRIRKGSKTIVEVSGLGASRQVTVQLGGARAERATVVVVCEVAAYAADDPIRLRQIEWGGDRADFGAHPLHVVGLRANAAAGRSEADRLLHPNTGKGRRDRFGHRYDNSWRRPAAFAAAIEIVDETVS